MALHPLLVRQLKRQYRSGPYPEEITDLLSDISEEYYRNDRAQHLCERALDLTSEEFIGKLADNRRTLHKLSGASEQVVQLLAMLNATVAISSDALLLTDHQGVPLLFSKSIADCLGKSEDWLIDVNQASLIAYISDITLDCTELQNQINQLQTAPSALLDCHLTLKRGGSLRCIAHTYQQEDEKFGWIWRFETSPNTYT